MQSGREDTLEERYAIKFCFPHPPYSPDFAPCDFLLLPKLKE